MKGWIILLEKSISALRDLFFPRRCAICDCKLAPDEKVLCYDCFLDIPLTWTWGWSGNMAEERLWEKVGIKAAASLYFYRNSGGYSQLVRMVKYGNDARTGIRLGRMLGGYLKESGRFDGIQAVVPVPLHPLRRWRRGYNQAEMAARGISEGMGLDGRTTNLLVRRRYTKTQTRLSAKQKESNVKKAFRLNSRIARKLKAEGITEILLVDDVLTSGSTLAAAAAELMPGFNVSIATIALVE